MKFSIPAPVLALCGTLERAGFSACVVGGAVRDLLLGRRPDDWDVCTAALPQDVQALFPKTVPTGIRHGTVTVLSDGMKVEVTTFRTDGRYTDGRRPDSVSLGATLEQDLSRRDFTIGAMAYRPAGEQLIDPFGGQADLTHRLIRCVGEPERRFREDALRIFRAARFSAQLDFTLEEQTKAAMFPCAHLAGRIAGERVKTELQKLLLSPAPQRVELLIRCGALNHWGNCRIPDDWTALTGAPAEPASRWRAFCLLTGFPPESLPMERALRRAILHPEEAVIRKLALSGGELMALGLQGQEISAAQRKLALHVLEHPEDNQRDRLLALLNQQET